LKPLISTLSGRNEVELSVLTIQTRFANNKSLFKNDNIHSLRVIELGLEARQLDEMSRAIGELVEKFGEAFSADKPDIVVIHGDRYEAMAAAIAATFNNIYIVHIQGGEVTGTADEHLRHAITKLSHFHLPSTSLSMERIIKMGEPRENVVCVGCPGIDLLLSAPKLDLSELKYELYRSANNRPEVLEKFRDDYILVMQSSVTTEVNKAGEQIRETLAALAKLDLLKIILLPNPDAGGDEIEKEILAYAREDSDNVLVFKHFPPEIFINLMRHAKAMVGNSSAGIRESGQFGVPVVNVGTRQNGRERTENIIDASGEKEISRVIKIQLEHGRYAPDALYGNGQSAHKIAELLLNLNYSIIQKRIAY